MHEVKDDKASFPVHTIDLDKAKVLIQPEQAEGAKGKNAIIGEPMSKNVNEKVWAREVTIEKTPDGNESLKITVKASRPGGQESSSRDSSRPAVQARPVRPVASTGQTGQTKGRPRTFKPKRPKGGTRKVNELKVQGSFTKQKPTFAQLLNKYTKGRSKRSATKKRAKFTSVSRQAFFS
jgi:hypothetical protein